MAPFWLRPTPSSALESLPNSPTLLDSPAVSIPVVAFTIVDDNALEAEAARGTHLVEDVLRKTLESKKIAVQTAGSLQSQTRQLKGIQDTIEETSQSLEGVERTVDKLAKGKLRRLAEGPTLKVVGGRMLRRERKKGGEGTNQGGLAKLRETSGRAERFEHRLEQLFGKESVSEEQVGGVIDRDEYSDFTNMKVRNHLIRQDRVLDETSAQLDELKDLALGIQTEIEQEAQIIHEIDAPEVNRKIRVNHMRLVRVLRL